MNRLWLFAPIVLAALPSVASAALSASATVTPSGGPATFHYDAVLDNTGSTTVGTFWFAWVPGTDFMLTSPTAVTSPAGWTDQITHFPNVATNGYAIQWTATAPADELAAGDTLSGFSFDTTDTSADLAGDSVFAPTTPVTTTFVYSGEPFSDSGFQFVTSVLPAGAPVPEPATLTTLTLAAGALLLRRRKPSMTDH